MFFKLNCLSHDSVLFVCFETFNILFTTAFSTDSKDEWSSKVVFLHLLIQHDHDCLKHSN